MAWIELHQSLTTHKKTRRLARALGLGVPQGIPQTIGHLCLFWLWCVDGTEDGSLADLDAQDIADAAGWTEDPESFTNAMITAGFLDRDEDGILTIHDWDDYIGRLIAQRQEAREKERLRKQKYRERKRTEKQEPEITSKPGEPFMDANYDGLDEGWVRVIRAYESNIGMLPGGTAGDNLQNFYDTLGPDLLIKAIKVTNDAQPNNPWKYLKAVLDKWIEKGIDTPSKADAYIKDLKRRIKQARDKVHAENEPPAIVGEWF